MDVSCVKGERIILTDNCSQTFSGVVKSVNTDLGRILLTDIIQIPGNKCIKGYRNFDKNEIKQIKKCEPDKPVATVDESIADNPVNDDVKKQVEDHAPKLSEVEDNEIKKLQQEFCFIRGSDADFNSAISHLKTCSIVGVFGKDVSKGRFERASILAISAPSKIFVFDLQGLSNDSFHQGLKDILESPSIIKVVHDCRLLSDCLKHKHLMNLENVRDVEAEDIMVVFQERRMVRRHSRPLEYLCKVYLGVEIEGCHAAVDDWNERPLPPALLENVVSHASFLLPLQEAIERKYLKLLVSASNVYNEHVRDLDFFDVLYNDPKKTLRKEMSKLLVPQSQVRSDCRPKVIS